MARHACWSGSIHWLLVSCRRWREKTRPLAIPRCPTWTRLLLSTRLKGAVGAAHSHEASGEGLGTDVQDWTWSQHQLASKLRGVHLVRKAQHRSIGRATIISHLDTPTCSLLVVMFWYMSAQDTGVIVAVIVLLGASLSLSIVVFSARS